MEELPVTPSVSQLHSLYRAGRSFARAAGPEEVYRTLLAAMAEVTGCTAVALYAACDSSDEQALLLNGSIGAHGAPPPQLVLGAEARAALRQGRPQRAVSTLGQAAAPLLEALGAGEAELLTVGGGERLHGALALAWGPGAERAAGWEQAALALAADGALALERCAEQTRAREREQIFDTLSGSVTAVTDIGLLYTNLIDRLLGAVLGQILEVLRLGGGALYLYNDQAEHLELAAWARGPETAYGPDPATLWEEPVLAHSLAQARETARLGYPVTWLDAAAPGDRAASPLTTALHGLRAANMVSVPLLAGGWLTGILQVAAAPGGQVSAEQMELLRILGRQAAVAIENARLFAQTRAEQERTRAVVDATNDAILMLDERRRPRIVNRRARFFFGLTERDLVGKSFDQLGGLFGRIFEDGPRFNGWLGQLLRSQSERAVEEFPILSPEPRLLQCYSAPVTDLHDRYLGRLLVFRDITREREVERMKNDFVSIVSHELRTPLTSIQGALQLVLGQPESGRPGMAEGMAQQGRDLLSISLANSERLIRLINDILDIAKIEQGRIQLRREPLAPEELCRSGAAAMAAFANNRGISVEVRVPPGLPEVHADRDRSAQVVINLLSNAIKFSQPGQRVELSARREGAMICFAVRDWGRGIAPEQQGRLFQKFQQLDSSATRDVGGTGLGLAISKALVEEQGGRMWLESQPGEGSRFSFTLPVSSSGEGEGAAAHPRGEETPAPAQARPHVLVVDDDPNVRPLLVRILQRHGMQVSNARDGYEAIAAAEEQRPDVILLDLKMPGLDGFEVLRRLKSRPETAAIPVIILTADDISQPGHSSWLDRGAHAFLAKPIAAERLISSVSAALGRDEGAV
jgi:PAS domain S-box-containing protein